jgi:hypothetical protein
MASQPIEVNRETIGSPSAPEGTVAGYLAEFDNVDDVMTAARAVRDAGFSRWDVHSPFPIHGIDAAMGIQPTILPWLVLAGGLTGLLGGLAMQFATNSFAYEYYISGKPLLSVPAFIPVTFETTVLLSAFAAVFGMLGLNKLPMLYNPLFRSERFRRVTNDRFFIVIDSADPKFDLQQTPRLLESLHPIAVERVED